MNQMKVVQTIRGLESHDIWHECLDIAEENLSDILLDYGIDVDLTDDEAQIVRDYLMGKAELAEFKEAVRWAHSEDELLLLIPDRPTPTPRQLEREHEAWKATVGSPDISARDFLFHKGKIPCVSKTLETNQRKFGEVI